MRVAPLVLVLSSVAACTAPPAFHRSSAPLPPSSAAAPANSWVDVTQLSGVTGDGTAEHPFDGWASQLQGRQLTYRFPRGIYQFDRLEIAQPGVRLVGDGRYETVLQTTATSGVAIRLRGQVNALESMDIGVRRDLVPEPSQILIDADNIGGGTQIRLNDLRLTRFGTGARLSGDTIAEHIRVFAGIDSGVGLHLLDSVGVTLHDVIVVVTANVHAAIDVEGSTRTPDTIQLSDVHVSYQGGTRWTALSVHSRSPETAPEWFKCVNCGFEAPNKISFPNDLPCVSLLAGRSLYFSSSYVFGGGVGLAIGDSGSFQGPGDIRLENTIVMKSLRDGIHHDAAASTDVAHCTITDQSALEQGRFAAVHLGPRSRMFTMSGTLLGRGIVLGATASQGVGLRADSGADRFFLLGNRLDGQRLGNAVGAVGPTLAVTPRLEPTCQLHHLAGSGVIDTIQPPPFDGPVTFIPDNDMSFSTAGNVATAVRAAAHHTITFTYDSAAGKWYPN